MTNSDELAAAYIARAAYKAHNDKLRKQSHGALLLYVQAVRASADADAIRPLREQALALYEQQLDAIAEAAEVDRRIERLSHEP